MPTRLKKRYSILLSDEIAERFERVARRRNGAKTAIIEEMLDQRFNPERYPLIDGILQRLDELSNEVAVATDGRVLARSARRRMDRSLLRCPRAGPLHEGPVCVAVANSTVVLTNGTTQRSTLLSTQTAERCARYHRQMGVRPRSVIRPDRLRTTHTKNGHCTIGQSEDVV